MMKTVLASIQIMQIIIFDLYLFKKYIFLDIGIENFKGGALKGILINAGFFLLLLRSTC